MRISILACNGRRNVFLQSGLVNMSIDDNNVQTIVILKTLNIFQRVSVNEDAIRKVSRLDLAEPLRSHEKHCHTCGCCDNGLVRSEAKQVLEMCQIASVRAMRCPCESIVARGRVSGEIITY